MKIIHWFYLFLLAAISGSSFIFTRKIAPILGPIGTADLRILVGGGALMIYIGIVGLQVGWRSNWKLYTVIGILNSGLPFLFFSYAALHLPASYLAILNASSPLFGAVFSMIWLHDRFSSIKTAGLLLGMLGVALVTYSGQSQIAEPMVAMSIMACLAAAVCYALSGILIKLRAKQVKPIIMAGCSQFSAGLLMLPFYVANPGEGRVTPSTLAYLAALALVCSAIAYLIYFKLMSEIGPARTLTVTFLSPSFAMIIGYLALHEKITGQMLIGAAVIIGSTFLVNRQPAQKKFVASPVAVRAR